MMRLFQIVSAAFAAFLFAATTVYAFGGGHGQGGGMPEGHGQGGGMPAGHGQGGGKSGPNMVESDGTDIMAGEVVETLESGGYTYVRLKNDKGEGWVAIPKQELELGEQMVFAPGDTMYDFESKTLKRKFDVIVFSPGPLYLPGTKVEKSMRNVDNAKEVDKVKAATGKDAYTVGDLYVKKMVLDGKTVKVRGKVVKVSKNIMKMNWVHIQDGSGDMKAGTHNLVVTTDAMPAVGDVVTVTGKVAANKDFGYGYKYEVILEEGKISSK